MPVYVLKEAQSNLFKLSRTQTDVAEGLLVFDEIVTDREGASEAFLHRHLREYRVVRGIGREFFHVDPNVIRRAVANLREMLAESEQLTCEVEQLKQSESSEMLLEPTTEDVWLYQRLLQIRREQELLSCERELVESRLKKRIGGTGGIRGVATWRTNAIRRYDERVFSRSMPELYGDVLERYYCIDTSRWKRERPEEYRQVQTTCFTPQVSRTFLLRKDG